MTCKAIILMFTFCIGMVLFIQCKTCSSSETVSDARKNDSLMVEIDTSISLNVVNFTHVDVFRKMSDPSCRKSLFFRNDTISSCFIYIKTINSFQFSLLLAPLFKKSSYPGLELSCSDYEYGFTLMSNETIVGWLMLDLVCEKVKSSPKILEQYEISHNLGYSVSSFSTLTKENLCKELRNLEFNVDCQYGDH